MRILHINSVYGYGSTGRIVREIHNQLLKEGHLSHVIYGRGEKQKLNNINKVTNVLSITTHVLESRILDNHGFSNVIDTKKIVKIFDDFKPDIVHLHNIHGYYLNIKTLFSILREKKIKVVWTLHDCWAFTGHCAHFENVECNKWITGCHSCPQTQSYPKSILKDNSKKNYEVKKEIFNSLSDLHLVTPSNWLKNKVDLSFFTRNIKTKVIHNGIDLSIFNIQAGDFREKRRIGRKFLILGVSSIWDGKKGYDFFLELSKYLSAEEVIVLVGVNDKQLKSLPENIIGIKRTESMDEMAQIYSTADVFLNPTLEDTFPTVNIEAIACGTPIVTFKTGGSTEIVNDVNGLVCEEKTIDEVMKKMNIIKNRKYNPIEVRKTAADYSKDRAYKEYFKLYNEIVGGINEKN